MRLLYATAITAVNVAVVWFWCRRARWIVEDAEREAQRIEDSARRSARRTAAIAAAQEQARRECSDGLPPGVYALVNEPFVGGKGIHVEEWTPLEDFACRKLDADGERRIVGFFVGDCRHKIDHECCPRIERLRELHARGCRLRHQPEDPPAPRGDAHADDGDGVAAEVRDEDGHLARPVQPVVDGPVPHEDARTPGEAVAPEVPEAEGETADGGDGNAPFPKGGADGAEDVEEGFHGGTIVAEADMGRKDGGENDGEQDEEAAR